MSVRSLTDRLLPARVITGSAETYRRGRLVVYAVAFCVLTPLPVALVLASVATPDLALRVLLGAVPSAATLALLWVTGSTRLAGHYLTGWIFLQTVVDFGHDTGFSLLAIFAIPILACALVGEKAGAVWTLASVAWVVSIGVTISPADPLYFGLVWSSAIVVAVVGAAVIVLEFTRTQARLEAESASIELLSQRERLRAFAERSFPAMAETDGPHLTYVSEGIQGTLGYTPAEFVQRRLTEYVHPEEFPGIIDQLNKVGSQGMRCEVRLRHAKGHWVWLEAIAIPYGPGENRWIFAGRDIGEEKQQRETLQQAQRLESAGLVAAGMAHDFNNLLTVILGYSELLPPGESKKEIIQATDQAAKLTRQLLAFARVDGLEAVAVDASALIQELQPMLRSILGSSIELETSSVAKTTSAAIAAGQLQQVLVNLWF